MLNPIPTELHDLPGVQAVTTGIVKFEYIKQLDGAFIFEENHNLGNIVFDVLNSLGEEGGYSFLVRNSLSYSCWDVFML